MPSSKLFSGNFPELINEIIQYLHNDFPTLHSCVLVNRLWCRTAIPLLWENPFSVPTKNCHLVEIYLRNLNEADKTKLLNEYEIDNEIFLSNTFNYPSFIKCLNAWEINVFVKKWAEMVVTTEDQFANYTKFENFTKLIYSLLFKIFIENEANLRTFAVEIATDIEYDYFEDSVELILQNQNFIKKIRNLRLYFYTTKIYSFLKFLYSNCNSISSLYLEFSSIINDTNYINDIERYSSQMIHSQQNLRKISFTNNEKFNLSNALLSLKNSNCSNTLQTAIFYHINFRNIVNFKEVIEQLNVLESVHFLYCSLSSGFIKQIANITKPFKLKSLFTYEMLQTKSLQLLLQKSGNYLENFVSEEYDGSELIELIIRYCTKIKSFNLLCEFCDNQTINLALNWIKNIEPSLNYLSIDLNNNKLLSSIVLLNLGQILPTKLEFLSLNLTTNANDFEIFLKNSQNTFIRRLFISYRIREENQDIDILPYIKEYIMKEKRVEYLGIREVFRNKKSQDLFFLKDEVNEFKLYNIKVEKLNNLCNFRTYEFISNMY